MKKIFTFTTSAIFAVDKLTIADKCHDVCMDMKRVLSFKPGCSAFRNSLPKPKISRYCRDGFGAAIDTNCYDACISGGRAQSFLVERRLEETCQGALQETPRPLCHDSCVHGYRSGLREMSGNLLSRIPEIKEAAKTEKAEPESSQATTENSKSQASENAEVDFESQMKYEEAQHLDESNEDNLVFAGDKVGDGEGGGGERTATNNKQDPVNEIEVVLTVKDLESMIDVVNEKDGVVLSLPVMINDIEKDLIIYEDDDSTEAVLAFCSENMSDEADKCADHFLGVVRDKLADYVTQISE